jgi:dethiobiotin synthetase
VTGRTHQLRFHMAEFGHAIAGDPKYSCDRPTPGGLERQLLLHARALRLPHPSGGELKVQAPLSPHMASRREGRTIAFQDVVEFCRKTTAAQRGLLLIEGVGGIMVPLDDRRTVLDLMSVLRIPAILVAGSYVGTISHTLTALEVMARRNLDIAAVVVSESEGSAASLEETAAAIAQFADAIDVVTVPRLAIPTSEHAAFTQIAGLISGSF